MITLNIKLPDHFLDEEVQDGFLVSQKRKEVWAVELDLLTEFDRVCKKYKLRYFADGGTLLGAIRHGGFIPWDDDIDLAMFRDDYDKLCSIALHEFKNPYFFQTEYTDRGSLRGHAQLRNSNTTAILRNSLNCKYKFNQGIFIDIFPMDSVTENQSK
ncbi:LicD family protein, partial [Acidaminococcus intestini]